MAFDFVCKASAAAAAATIGIFSWNEMEGTFWLARALFYFSLSLSLWAVITAAQQGSIVGTLPVAGAHTQARHTAEVVLRRRPGSGTAKSFAEVNMLYVWQCPLMLIAYGWVMLLIALTLHVCSPLISRTPESGQRVAIFYLATGSVFFFFNFAWCSAWVCWTPSAPKPADAEDGKLESPPVAVSEAMDGCQKCSHKASRLVSTKAF